MASYQMVFSSKPHLTQAVGHLLWTEGGAEEEYSYLAGPFLCFLGYLPGEQEDQGAASDIPIGLEGLGNPFGPVLRR